MMYEYTNCNADFAVGFYSGVIFEFNFLESLIYLGFSMTSPKENGIDVLFNIYGARAPLTKR